MLVAFVRALDEDRGEDEFFDEAGAEKAVIIPPLPHAHEGIEIIEDRTAPPVLFPIPGDDAPADVDDERFASAGEAVPVQEGPEILGYAEALHRSFPSGPPARK